MFRNGGIAFDIAAADRARDRPSRVRERKWCPAERPDTTFVYCGLVCGKPPVRDGFHCP